MSTGIYNATPPTLVDGQTVAPQVGTRGSANVSLFGPNSTVGADVVSNGIDGLSAAAGIRTNTQNLVYNGASWDRQRGDANGAVAQSALSSTFWNYSAAVGGIVNTATAVTIKAAAGASIRNYLKTLHISHDLLGGATEIAIRDGAAGTVLWRGRLQTPATDSASGAGNLWFDPPLKGTANTLMEVVTLTAVTGGVYVNATGFTGI